MSERNPVEKNVAAAAIEVVMLGGNGRPGQAAKTGSYGGGNNSSSKSKQRWQNG